MAVGSLYKKFGVGTDPGMALVKGQEATGQAFKDVLGSISSMMDDAEKGYVEENTLNMQEYLKKSIKDAGLGADVTDQTAIKQKFGSLINMDDIDSTVNETREGMVTDAVDQATGIAGQAFGETEDIADAGNAFKQSLMSSGMKESEATKQMQTWRNDNQFLAEDVKHRDEGIINSASDAMLSDMRNTEFSYEEIEQNIIADMSPKLQKKAMLKMRADYDIISKMTPEQQDEYAFYVGNATNQANEQIRLVDQREAEAKTAVDNIAGIPDSATVMAGSLSQSLGGIGEAIAKDASNGWFKGIFRAIGSTFNPDEVTGHDVATHLQSQVRTMVRDYKISPEDAGAIAVAAYQENKAIDSTNVAGVRLLKSSMDNTMNQYLQQHADRTKAQGAYTRAQQQATSQRSRINQKLESIKYGLKKGEKRSNVTGNAFSQEAFFKDNLIGSVGSGPATTKKTASASTVKPLPLADLINIGNKDKAGPSGSGNSPAGQVGGSKLDMPPLESAPNEATAQGVANIRAAASGSVRAVGGVNPNQGLYPTKLEAPTFNNSTAGKQNKRIQASIDRIEKSKMSDAKKEKLIKQLLKKYTDGSGV